ncbi:MAG TPA: EAL domain-containing protein [Candidatus Limnocylindria bacterium]|nr:EAL domain-containing protein [Candidatus Limnocylindria bacterium]
MRHVLRFGWRPGLRTAVLSICAILTIGTAFAVSTTVSDHLATTAVDEAVRTTEAVVRGFVDPMVASGGLDGSTSDEATAIDAQLSSLVAAGKILRIKIWTPDGVVAYSDLPALRGRTFPLEDDLEEALDGEVATEFTAGDDEENVFERGLADRFLSIYLPIHGTNADQIVGAYEIYEDAAPIEAQIAASRRDVLLIVGGMGLALLALLFAAFAGTSRLLAGQNLRLRRQAITEQLLMTDLRRSEERFRSLAQNSADVNMIVGADGVIVYESTAVQRVLGYQAEDRVGQRFADAIHPDDRAWAEQLLADVIGSTGAQLSGDLRVRHADGSWRTIETVLKNLLVDPAVGGIVVNYRDVTVRKGLEDELRHQAFHDALTGLPNRALFADRLEHALSRTRRSQLRLAVLFIDLDDFKTVNDSLGHGEGDRLLMAVGDRLQRALRAGDTIARMGGDEFAVLVEDPADAGGPVEVAQRLLDSLQAPFEGIGKELFVHASVGVAVSTSQAQTSEELLRDADISMYKATSNGKNRLEVFEPGMHTAALDRMALKGDLERALDRGEFAVLYQPIMRLGTGRMAGVEALVRWHHPRRGLVGPLDFIPLAEETGLIVPLGRWVLEQACRQAVAWDATGGGQLRMSVNVSGRQTQQAGFVAEVDQVLRETGLDPSRLTLEFTESVLMRDADATTHMLRELKKLGVRLAIDDFGTGYSSLSYLRRFPIDVLKIDGSFVASMSSGADQAALVRSILKLGETLRLETVAEGIEEVAQLNDLQELGADLGQGFYFAHPLSADAIAEQLAAEASGTERIALKRSAA